jgi:serine/threonine-protein kinase
VEAVVDLAVGSVFAGRYRIARRIAAGGMGAVYEVIHLETERRRALKVMHAHLFQSEELRERFKREAKVAAHVDSEFIVDVFDAGVDEATGMPFLVMELLRGEELGQRLKRVGRLPVDEALLYLHQTARALDKTHRASIVHRDLKPANVFLCERDEDTPRVKILDFGIAKVVAEGATTGAGTQSLGTPLYMAPEQFNPSAKLTGAADIYARAPKPWPRWGCSSSCSRPRAP